MTNFLLFCILCTLLFDIQVDLASLFERRDNSDDDI
jgi:hypothetical protein